MKRMIIIALSAIMVLCTLGFSSCKDLSANPTDTDQGQNTEGGETESRIRMNGSTSMKKVVEALNEVFNQKYSNITAEAQFTGSGTGLEAAASGTADIGNSSRALKDEEKEKGLTENIIAIDGIAVIVNQASTIDNLTLEQLAKIYKGEITNWKEVGAQEGKIVVIGRESGSGTRGAFEELLKIEDQCKYAQELDQTGAVMSTVASTPGSIGYISLDILNDTVKALKIEGVEPTVETIQAGNYKLSRPFVMATKGALSEQSEAVKKYFAFIESDEGQQIIKNVGLITVE